MARLIRASLARFAQAARRTVRPVTRPAATGGRRAGRFLWGQRFHWPVFGLGTAVVAASILAPAMSTPATVAAQRPLNTLPANSLPGLPRHTTTAPSTASVPANLVPACAGGTGSLANEASGRGRTGGRSATFSRSPGQTVVTLAALSLTAPSVTGVSPSSGPVTGGTAVTIDGSGFTGATLVTFGLVPATFSVASDTQITATSPPGVGTVDVHVVTLGGPSASGSGDQFTYVLPALPSLPSLPSAPGAPGSGSGSGSGSGPGSGSGSGGGSGSGSGSGTGSNKTTAPSAPAPVPTGTMPPNTVLTPPAIAPSTGTLPGFTFGDGQLGCGLIDSTTGTQVAGESAAQERAVQLALSFIGTPYVWGGESPHGFDCSGLVQFVYSAAGISLPRVAQNQYDAGPAVAPGQTVVPGDLIFFGGGPNDVSHVGIFVGNGVMVDAPHTGANVRLDQINGGEPIVGVTDPGQ